jgi:hypothetical protein
MGFLEVVADVRGIAQAITAVADALGKVNTPRSCILEIDNKTDLTLTKVSEHFDSGGWGVTPERQIPPQKALIFGAQSPGGALFVGAIGNIVYEGGGVRVTAMWGNPFIGANVAELALLGRNNKYGVDHETGVGNADAHMRYELFAKDETDPLGANENWTQGAFYGNRGTFFADLTGDGKADAIVVNDKGVTVRLSTGNDFGPPNDWSHGPFYGQRGTFFADLTGDGKADAIAVNDDTVWVRPSTGKDFGPHDNIEDWSHGPFYGQRGTFFADVTGDGKADAIAINDDLLAVRQSTGHDLAGNQVWAKPTFWGNRGTYFADLTADGKADAIAINDDSIWVRRAP